MEVACGALAPHGPWMNPPYNWNRAFGSHVSIFIKIRNVNNFFYTFSNIYFFYWV